MTVMSFYKNKDKNDSLDTCKMTEAEKKKT